MNKKRINIIGAGLAGSEAAYYLAKKGYEINLYEMRPNRSTGAHHTGYFGELVCSNSLKSKQITNACGLLKEEMRILGSIMIESSDINSVPSGNALSVDRDNFAKYITDKLLKFENINFINEEVKELPKGITIIATGPLTSTDFLNFLETNNGVKALHFFDASAPIVTKESIDMNVAYFKSRYEQGDNSYINCAFDKEEYMNFYNNLISAQIAPVHDFDTNYFEGCMPIEVMAKRGIDTLRYGPMKPKGLRKDENHRPHAVVQLRQDNVIANLYNIVGFQTNLTYSEQKRVFRMIPGLENAEFVRYGLMHRNTYVCAPALLNFDLSVKNNDEVYITGQLCGVEGYVESAATGLYAAIAIDKKIKNENFEFPKNTMLFSLVNYICNASVEDFSPMNSNFGIIYGVTKNNREEFALNSLKEMEAFVKE